MDKQAWQEKGAGHRERLRTRYLEQGLEGFSDTDILELLLSFGTPRKDCKEVARQLLHHCGSLAAVFETPIKNLMAIDGIGPKNSFAIGFVRDVAGRYLKQRIEGKRYLHSSSDARNFLEYSLRGLKKEVLTVIYLDASHAILGSEVVAEGTINVNTIYPREIIFKALEYHATALIIAHNHPSGGIKPSTQDLQLTRNLQLICSSLQLQLLDHFIVGDSIFSFSDNGLMEEIAQQCSAIKKEHNFR